jgi:hypothetical protein
LDVNFLINIAPPGILSKQKTELTKGSSFGSSAIFNFKTRHFPSPSHKGFGFIGKTTI